MTSSFRSVVEDKRTQVAAYALGWHDLIAAVQSALNEAGAPCNEIWSARQSAFKATTAHLQRALERPEVILATTGTTSGGKSTVVNFLCGAELTPMAVQEMSAGVVKIRHRLRTELRILATDHATWETGTWSGLGDKDIRDQLRKTMDRYREARESDDLVAPPLVEIDYPTRLGLEPELLGLPPECSLTIVDLPGLKYVGDSLNATVIREECQQALCLVTYNSEETDSTLQKELLAEVISQVRALRGSPARMLFLLNRIDAFRKDDDWPAGEDAFVATTRAGIRRDVGAALPEYSDEAARLCVTRFSSMPALKALQAMRQPGMAASASEYLDKNFRALIPDDIIDILPRKAEAWTPADHRNVFAAVMESSYANDVMAVLKNHVHYHLPELVLPVPLKKIVDAGSEGLNEADQRLNACLNASAGAYEAERARLERLGCSLEVLRAKHAELLAPLQQLPSPTRRAQHGEFLAHLESAAKALQKATDLPTDALVPLHAWWDAIAQAIESVFESLLAPVRKGTGTLTGVLETLPVENRIQLRKALEQLTRAGYSGKGEQVSGHTQQFKDGLRATNAALNAFASAVASSLPVIVGRVADQEGKRATDALGHYFEWYARHLTRRAAALAPDMAGLQAPPFGLASARGDMSWAFELHAGFPVVTTEKHDHVRDDLIKIGERRLWYTLWLAKEDITELKPVHEQRNYDNSTIPSLSQILDGFMVQVKALRPEAEFERWLQKQID